MSGYERPGRDLCENLSTRILALPGVMRQKGWLVASRLMERWLSMPANSFPDFGAHDTTTIRMFWVLRFPHAGAVYATAKANRVWVNEAAKRVIVDKLIHRKGRLPKEVGERLEIGNVGESLPLSGSSMLQFHNDWQVQFREVKQSMMFSRINELYGALGNFSFYFVVKGHVERIADKDSLPRYKVTLNKVGGYVRDSYDFNDRPGERSQTLGWWRCVPPSVGKLPTWKAHYVANQDFRMWREQYGHGRGGDFLVFSNIDRFDTNDSFVF